MPRLLSQMYVDANNMVSRLIDLAKLMVTYVPPDQREFAKKELLLRVYRQLGMWLVDEGLLAPPTDSDGEESEPETQTDEEDPN